MNYEVLALVSTIIGLILGLVLHEFAHAWMGHYLGDSTAKDQGRLTLNPASHIDPFTTLLLPLFLIIAGLPVFAAAKPVPPKAGGGLGSLLPFGLGGSPPAKSTP